ncbi:hypothetical protein RRG08_057765 [Elysia crispata]|uniref:Uncharacterized protein n=1 Tax=Elysia crispata TaxID=231223 RepID=A0AAE0Y831_9GAST|nr:hypothetical protein RRG08_057765 [Elysia crispata]
MQVRCLVNKNLDYPQSLEGDLRLLVNQRKDVMLYNDFLQVSFYEAARKSEKRCDALYFIETMTFFKFHFMKLLVNQRKDVMLCILLRQ